MNDRSWRTILSLHTKRIAMKTRQTETSEERSEILRDIKSLNNISMNDIAYITGEKYKTIDAWLYDKKKSPSWKALYLLNNAIVTAGGKIPRPLTRLLKSDIARAKRWAAKNKFSNFPQYVGEIKEPKMRHWIYCGEERTSKEIAGMSGLSQAAVINRIRRAQIPVGADATAIINRNLRRGRRPRTTPGEGFREVGV